jgi:hypothetical protein
MPGASWMLVLAASDQALNTHYALLLLSFLLPPRVVRIKEIICQSIYKHLPCSKSVDAVFSLLTLDLGEEAGEPCC